MKKWMVVLLMALMIFSLAACSQSEPDEKKDPEGGNVHNNEENVLNGEEVPDDAPNGAGYMQIGNPWVDCATLDEAAKVAGFDIAIPGKFDGYENKVYQAVEKTIIQVLYYDGDPEAENSSRIIVRKSVGTNDSSGDYNEYSEKETTEDYGLNVLLKGEKGLVYCATWIKDGYFYAILADKGLTKEALSRAIQEMITEVG